jgi:arginine N-succinyltransferase
MMGPLNESSISEFWEGFGRRFINLSFQEADLFCQRSKEFITSLFPKEEIYVSLLSPGARNAIGRVGLETEPALRLLERVGFHEMGHIDPFDAGPYLQAKTDDIELVKQTKMGTLAATGARGDFPQYGFVSLHRGADFRAVRTPFGVSAGKVAIPAEALEALGADAGEGVACTPLEEWARPRAARGGRTRSAKAAAK